MNLSFIVGRIVDKFGKQLRLKRRTESVDSERRVTYKYSSPVVIKGMVTPITPPPYTFEQLGIRIDGEYLASFTPSTSIEEGDLVEIDSEWYEVAKKFNRGDFIEVVLRRRS